MPSHSSDSLTYFLLVALLFSACWNNEKSERQRSQTNLLSSKYLNPVPSYNGISLWGLVPYWNNLPTNPIHPPRAVYLDLYWRDLKPKQDTKLTAAWVVAAIEKRLNRPLSAEPK